jgi:hypothetical protein
VAINNRIFNLGEIDDILAKQGFDKITADEK